MRRPSTLLVTAAALLATASAVAQGNAEPHCLVIVDREARPYEAPPAGADEPAADHAWLWSASHPPRKVAPADCAPDRARAALAASPSALLTVHLSPRERSSALDVIAAPHEMWEEVPEPMLPRHRVASDTAELRVPVAPATAWRLRAVPAGAPQAGEGLGTWWVDVRPGARGATLAPVPAPTHTWRIASHDGHPLPGTRLSVLVLGPGPNEVRKLADYRTDEHSAAVLPALPDERPVQVLAAHDEHAPALLRGTPSALAGRVWPLDPGSSLRGRFLTAEGLPQHGVRVRVRGWLDDELPLPLVHWTASGTDGRWEVGALPRQPVEVYADADGHLPYVELVEVAAPDHDLGDLTLPPAATIALRVVDDLGVPRPGARVTVDGRPAAATSDDEGRAWLDVAADRPFELSVEADRHLPAASRHRPPHPERLDVVVDRGFVLEGRFVDDTGAPLGDGFGRFWQGTRMGDLEVAADGTFAVTLPPETPARLELASPRTATLAREIEPGARGEVRRLGDLAAPAGLAVAGRLVRADTAAPVAGARIWLPRPSEMGPLVAWMLEDLLETRSDAEGRFELTGAPPVPLALRIEAPGLARRIVGVVPEAGQRRVELGDVELGAGATVVVTLVEEGPRNEEPAAATVDLGGQRLPADLLSAPVVDGSARIPRVPAGEVVVSVARGPALLCERTVEVPASPATVEVECRSRAVHVSGEVRIGGHPMGPGTLSWMPPSSSGVPEGILSYGEGALRRSRTFSASRPSVHVTVDDEGAFASDALRPGRWEVLWQPVSGPSVGPRAVEIPDVDRHRTVLDFPGLAVAGTVVDADGAPVPRARVRALPAAAFAVAGDDGAFTLGGLEPGVHHLQARTPGASSRPLEVRLEADRPPDPVELVIGEREPDLRLRVTEGGVPAAGALVFLEEAGAPLRILTADRDGGLDVELQAPGSIRLRLAAHAAGRWTLGTWRGRPAPGEAEEVELPIGSETGSLAVVAEEGSGRPRILAAGGWDLAALLAWLGTPPRLSPSTPLLVAGLPPGRYEVVLGERRESAEVEVGEVTTVELD